MDLQNARVIYGPCPHCLEGKPQSSKCSHKSFHDSLKPTEPGELLHCDIVFIKGKPRLFSVDHVSGALIIKSFISLVLIMNPSLRANNLLFISMAKVSRLPFAYHTIMKRLLRESSARRWRQRFLSYLTTCSPISMTTLHRIWSINATTCLICVLPLGLLIE